MEVKTVGESEQNDVVQHSPESAEWAAHEAEGHWEQPAGVLLGWKLVPLGRHFRETGR